MKVSNGITLGVTRVINWIHLPVPKARQDDSYFAPLANLEISPDTELYLGLIHASDGLSGARERVQGG